MSMTGRRLGALGVAVVVVVIAASCGDPGSLGRESAGESTVGSTVESAPTAIRGTADSDVNVAVSPASVAYALAMLEPGTVGDAQTQLRNLLQIDDSAKFHASMNALQQALEARTPTEVQPGDDPGEITVRIANAAYLQQGYPFEPTYLAGVGANYGPVLNEVDFHSDPDGVARDINAFVADATTIASRS